MNAFNGLLGDLAETGFDDGDGFSYVPPRVFSPKEIEAMQQVARDFFSRPMDEFRKLYLGADKDAFALYIMAFENGYLNAPVKEDHAARPETSAQESEDSTSQA